MKLEFGMGSGVQTVELPEKNLMGVLRANAAPAIASEEEEVRRALREPVGSPRLREILHPGQTVAIITSDLTRPMPPAKVMPPLPRGSDRRISRWSLPWAATDVRAMRRSAARRGSGPSG